MYLSIAPEDASRDALFALACELGRKNAKEHLFHAVFFDNFDSARGYRLHQEGEPKISRLSLRAGYSFDRGKGFHTFSWWPKRGNPDRIDVELGSPPVQPARRD
jgi:hypothetical protein